MSAADLTPAADAAGLCHLGQRISSQALVESMLRIPARGLANLAFPLHVAAVELARIPAGDARVLLLSDCVHNAGPDPRPFATRLPRLDVLLDATGEQDRWLGGELARLGRGSSASPPATEMLPQPSVRSSQSEESAVAVVIVARLFPVPECRDEAIAALDGKLAQPMDVQLLTPHPAGSAEKGAL